MCVEFLVPQVLSGLLVHCCTATLAVGCRLARDLWPPLTVPLSPIPLSVLFLPSFLPASSMWSLSSLFKQRRVTQNGSARMVGWVCNLQATLGPEVVMRECAGWLIGNTREKFHAHMHILFLTIFDLLSL